MFRVEAENGHDRPGESTLDRARLAAGNIHPETLLSTDYLNHFNEVVMLIDMLAEMPDCALDVMAWEPRSYVEHFRASRFTARELAISAYGAVRRDRRQAFEVTIAAMDAAILDLQRLIREAPMETLPVECIVDHAEMQVKPLLAHAMGLINGAPPVIRVTEEGGEAQSAVDALFR